MSFIPQNSNAEDFHKSLFVFDGLHNATWNHDFLAKLRQGGHKAVHRSIGGAEGVEDTIKTVERETAFIEKESDTLALAHSVAEIREANRSGRIAAVFGFQGTEPIEGDWQLLATYKRLGVEIIQLTYNRRNWLGDGSTERTNCGLSDLGVKVVEELNRLRMVVDCAHTGENTTLDAIEVSKAPIVISHTNVLALCDNPRNVSDRVIRAVAAKGGVIGLTSFSYFLSKTRRATLSDFLDHVDYIKQLVGADHVALGLDIIEGWNQEEALAPLDRTLFKEQAYPPLPWTYAEGLSGAADVPNVTKGLLQRSYTEVDIRKIMGQNFLRVLEAVWGR
jgi:membrane dipeptidase